MLGVLYRSHVAGPLSSLDRSGMAPSAVPDAVIDDQILEESGAPKGFDFLSIDVEGHEVESFARVRSGALAAAFDPDRRTTCLICRGTTISNRSATGSSGDMRTTAGTSQ
jgi:hypothetical protein